MLISGLKGLKSNTGDAVSQLDPQPRSQALSPLPPLSRRETLGTRLLDPLLLLI